MENEVTFVHLYLKDITVQQAGTDGVTRIEARVRRRSSGELCPFVLRCVGCPGVEINKHRAKEIILAKFERGFLFDGIDYGLDSALFFVCKPPEYIRCFKIIA